MGKRHRCMRCFEEYDCPAPTTCSGQFEVLPSPTLGTIGHQCHTNPWELVRDLQLRLAARGVAAHALIASWRLRADYEDRKSAGPHIAAYRECADELEATVDNGATDPAIGKSEDVSPAIGSATPSSSSVALQAEQDASGWQPIATAPTGRTLIGYTVKLPEQWVRVGLGAKSSLGGDWLWHQDVPWAPATHWMPLPSPPRQAAQDAGKTTPKCAKCQGGTEDYCCANCLLSPLPTLAQAHEVLRPLQVLGCGCIVDSIGNPTPCTHHGGVQLAPEDRRTPPDDEKTDAR